MRGWSKAGLSARQRAQRRPVIITKPSSVCGAETALKIGRKGQLGPRIGACCNSEAHVLLPQSQTKQRFAESLVENGADESPINRAWEYGLGGQGSGKAQTSQTRDAAQHPG